MKYPLIFLLLLYSSVCLAQDGPDQIKTPKNAQPDKDCYTCIKAIRSKPADILFGVIKEGRELFFAITDPDWLDQVITRSKDGIAVDIVTKDQFNNCSSKKIFKRTDYFRGTVLEPVYKKQIEETSTYAPSGYLMFKLGEVPNHLVDKEIEFNLIFIQNKHYCFYHTFYDIVGHNWELLETGLFVDTLSEMSAADRAILFNKKFEFEVPFEQNQYVFKEEDIKPIYDSLSLYDYDIKGIEVEAYSSLEGDVENNRFLQQKRAESIVKAIEDLQGHAIPKKITTAANWVDFFNDIKGTAFSSWVNLNKGTIKNRLRDEQTLERLEPILSKHRKAVLYLTLEKKANLTFENEEEIIELFDQSVRNKDLSEALKIQKSAFYYARQMKDPLSFMDKLEVPTSSEYSLLYNNHIVYGYELAPEYIYARIADFKRLLEIVPENPRVLYNLYALQLKAWAYGDPILDPEELLQQINKLKSTELPVPLVNRLLINYYIIQSERYQFERRYKAKSDAVRKIYSMYHELELSAQDAVSIAKYFVNYQKYDWAITLLKPFLADIHTPEDVLFYYINLTIIDDKLVGTNDYRTMLSNAINKNPERFCGLFNSINDDGITFQLLNNLYLRKVYCESCK